MTRAQIAAKLRALASQENHDGEPWDTMIEAAAMLDRDEKIEDLDQRMREMEAWQSGFDGEWSDHTIEHNDLNKRLEEALTAIDR